MSSAAITTANTVNTSTDNANQPQQKQTAKEVIAANVQALIEQLEQGHSEGLTAYLTAMGRFHNYSFGNILEIARQNQARFTIDQTHACLELLMTTGGFHRFMFAFADRPEFLSEMADQLITHPQVDEMINQL